jgi:SAM-dependent methyltransferase
MHNDETIWRQVLSENWSEMRSKTDWMGLSQMHDHVAEVMTGKRRAIGGDWVDWTLHNHLLPLLANQSDARRNKPDDGLTLVSFGCGAATIEQAFLQRKWPIRRIVCREFDVALLERAERNLSEFKISKSFEQFDFNQPETNGVEKFDIAFFCHSLHHCTDIERFLPYLNSVLEEKGRVIGLDYFGPTRLQILPEVKSLLDEIFHSLPPNLRVNLANGANIEHELYVATIEELRRNDPSEAARTGDLRDLLFSSFPLIEKLNMGGTLLRPLLAHRAGNFRSESDLCILKLLSILERELIRTRSIESDNLYFALGKSNRFGATSMATVGSSRLSDPV